MILSKCNKNNPVLDSKYNIHLFRWSISCYTVIFWLGTICKSWLYKFKKLWDIYPWVQLGCSLAKTNKLNTWISVCRCCILVLLPSGFWEKPRSCIWKWASEVLLWSGFREGPGPSDCELGHFTEGPVCQEGSGLLEQSRFQLSSLTWSTQGTCVPPGRGAPWPWCWKLGRSSLPLCRTSVARGESRHDC